jgi:hypothetical protein
VEGTHLFIYLIASKREKLYNGRRLTQCNKNTHVPGKKKKQKKNYILINAIYI